MRTHKSIIKNRKAAMLLYLSTIALLIAALAFLTIKVSEKPAKLEPKYIGEHQIALLKTAVNADKLLLFIDQASKPTAMQSIYGLGQKGGFAAGSECGQYMGYEKWRTFSEVENGIKNCIPDEKTIKYDLSYAMNNELYRYLNAYWGKSQQSAAAGGSPSGAAVTGDSILDITGAPVISSEPTAVSLPLGVLGEMPPNNYEVNLEQEEDRLGIMGLAKEKAEFDIVLGQVKRKSLAKGTDRIMASIIPGGVAAGECHYCNNVREEIKKWSQEDYQKCKAQSGMCCKAACPPGSKIVPEIVYHHQCDPALRSATTGCQPRGRSSCTSGCGPISFKMGLEAFGINMDIKDLFCPGENSVYEPGGGQPSWMERVAKKLGLVGSEHIEGGIKTDEEFRELVRDIVSGKPTLISITEEGRSLDMERCRKTAGHYVLGIGGNDDYLIINDPYAGSACPRLVGEHLVLTKQHVKTATAGKGIVYIGKGSGQTAIT